MADVGGFEARLKYASSGRSVAVLEPCDVAVIDDLDY